MNEKEEMYGFERLMATIDEGKGLDANSVQAGDNDNREIFMLNPDVVARFVVPYNKGLINQTATLSISRHSGNS